MTVDKLLDLVRGQVIESLKMEGAKLTISFSDGDPLVVEDVPSCCEVLYFTTEEDLTCYEGATFLDIKEGAYAESNDEPAHETKVLDLVTSRGVCSFMAHNEHSGYYSGIHPYYTLGDLGPESR